MTTPQTDRPTDQPENVPTCYVSLRLTVNHDQLEDIKGKVLQGYEYVGYTHKGRSGDNPHFHFFIPTGDKRVSDCIRKRAKDKLGLSGNSSLSVSYRSNGILNGITYGSKEGSCAIVSSPDMARLVDLAPEYVHQAKNIGGYMRGKPMGREPDPDHFKIITPRNIEKVTLRYRMLSGIKSIELEDTLDAMHRDNWRLQETFLRNGIMESYFDSFRDACRGKHHWTSGKFIALKRFNFKQV